MQIQKLTPYFLISRTDEQLNELLWEAARERKWKCYDILRQEWRNRHPMSEDLKCEPNLSYD